MRLPKSQLTENQHTPGNEFIDTSNNKVYSGYYFIANGRYFIGKTFDLKAIELKRITPTEVNTLNIINNLPFNLPSSITSKLATSVSSDTAVVTSISADSSTGRFRYFSKQTNIVPIIIKEVSQSTFDNIKSNPLYQTLAISSNNIYVDSPVVNEAEKTFSGIKAFLGF
jgi:hypothetical protein